MEKKDNLVKINKYVIKNSDDDYKYIIIEGDIKELTEQIKILLLEKDFKNE